MFVLKIGGNEIDQPAFLQGLCAAVGRMPAGGLLVHGGGKEIAAALDRAAIPSEKIDGVRVTTPEAMVIVEQILSGAVNKRLVRLLNAAGVAAIGLSGVDLELLTTEPFRPGGRDLGRVGEIIRVRREVLDAMVANGWLPVISPVSLDADDHNPTNVNADHAALAIAAAIGADELIFVSNVPGVLVAGAVVPELSGAAVESYITDGTINGGMIPKVRSAIDALLHVPAVRITDLAGLREGGTRFVNA
ncbi:MAG: acetylglutamate kinase [Herpetosiphon sp.]